MRGRAPRRLVSELVLDAGVLEDRPLLELYGWTGAAAVGGAALLPWRRDWQQARAAGVNAVAGQQELPPQAFTQALVHLQKGWAATAWGFAAAWRHLEPGGRLLLCGGNELGVRSAVRRLEQELGVAATILANRLRGRVVCWPRGHGPGPVTAQSQPIPVEVADQRFSLSSAPGVFSADALDSGSRLLLEHLLAPGNDLGLHRVSRIFDPGCGIGVLALTALQGCPGSTAVLADADHRAVVCAEGNAAGLGLAERCQVVWWDAPSEPPPLNRCDLVLLNPPFHRGTAVDLEPARAMFQAVDHVLAPGGTALIVANQTLPYERGLRAVGELGQVAVHSGYKLLRLQR